MSAVLCAANADTTPTPSRAALGAVVATLHRTIAPSRVPETSTSSFKTANDIASVIKVAVRVHVAHSNKVMLARAELALAHALCASARACTVSRTNNAPRDALHCQPRLGKGNVTCIARLQASKEAVRRIGRNDAHGRLRHGTCDHLAVGRNGENLGIAQCNNARHNVVERGAARQNPVRVLIHERSTLFPAPDPPNGLSPQPCVVSKTNPKGAVGARELRHGQGRKACEYVDELAGHVANARHLASVFFTVIALCTRTLGVLDVRHSPCPSRAPQLPARHGRPGKHGCCCLQPCFPLSDSSTDDRSLIEGFKGFLKAPPWSRTLGDRDSVDYACSYDSMPMDNGRFASVRAVSAVVI